jgi:hypothetical protein
VQTVYFRVHQLGLRIVQQSTQHPLQGRRFDDVDVCGQVHGLTVAVATGRRAMKSANAPLGCSATARASGLGSISVIAGTGCRGCTGA